MAKLNNSPTEVTLSQNIKGFETIMKQFINIFVANHIKQTTKVWNYYF